MRKTTIQNLWDTLKAVLRGKFIISQAYLRKQEKLKQSNLILKGTGKKQQTKPEVSRREEVIKATAEINKIGSKKTIQKIHGSFKI